MSLALFAGSFDSASNQLFQVGSEAAFSSGQGEFSRLASADEDPIRGRFACFVLRLRPMISVPDDQRKIIDPEPTLLAIVVDLRAQGCGLNGPEANAFDSAQVKAVTL